MWVSPMFCMALVMSCTRAEPAPSGGPPTVLVPSATKSQTVKPAADPARAEARCIWPMLALSPPVALPAKQCPLDDRVRPPRLAEGSVSFVDAPGRPRITVEIATDAEDQTRGLMYRKKLEPDGGMLFWGETETVRRFWMHNTCIPLDMLFMARDGLIVGILEQVPTMNDESRGVPCPSAHVLEVNAGWSRSHGIKPGQRVSIER